MSDQIRCQAVSRSTQTQCGNTAPPGLTVCWRHGANSPQSKAKSARYTQAKTTISTARRFGTRADIGANDALLEELQYTAGHVRWLRCLITDTIGQDDTNDGDVQRLLWGKTSEVDKQATEFTGVDTTYTTAPHPLWAMYERERDRLVRLGVACANAGIEERRQRLAEEQGEQVVRVIRGVLAAFLAALLEQGLSRQFADLWPTLATQIVPAQLRALTEAA